MGYTVDASGRSWIHSVRQTEDTLSFDALPKKLNPINGYLYELILDLKASKLHFSVNDDVSDNRIINKGNFSFNIKKSDDIEYKFAMSLCTKDNSVTVIGISFR